MPSRPRPISPPRCWSNCQSGADTHRAGIRTMMSRCCDSFPARRLTRRLPSKSARSMTIARRLTLLLAIPLLALVAFGVFVEIQIGRVEVLSRFVVDTQIQSVATLGEDRCVASRKRGSTFANYLLAQNPAEQDNAAKASAIPRQNWTVCCRRMARAISSDEDRRLWNAFLDLHRRWSGEARENHRRWPAEDSREAAHRPDVQRDLSRSGSTRDQRVGAVGGSQRAPGQHGWEPTSDGSDELPAEPADRRGTGPVAYGHRWDRHFPPHCAFRSGDCRSRSKPSPAATIRNRCPSRKPPMRPEPWRAPSEVLRSAAAEQAEDAGSRQTSPSSPERCKGRRPTRSSRAGWFRGWCRRWAAALPRFYIFESDQQRLRRVASYGLATGAGREISASGRGARRPVRTRPLPRSSDRSAAGLSADFFRDWVRRRRRGPPHGRFCLG